MLSNPVILAIASATGHSPRGIVRISGPGTFELVRSHVSLTESHVLRARCARRGTFSLTKDSGIPIFALVFPAPHSYTGEDSMELQLPGNPMLLDRVIDALLQTAQRLNIDARRATAGEFTARAYLNGRMSLTQAEGVAATIAAQSDAELRAAHLLLSGALGSVAHELADALANALALVEAGIDFTDQEDVIAITPDDLYDRLHDLHRRIQTQLDRSIGSEQLRSIPWVVLVGEPNAGKSALFNALLGRERAVVSPTAGTTRDVLTEPLMIQTVHGPAEVMLVDLAGLDESDDSSINRLMQHAAREAIERAELTLRCVPVDQESLSPQRANDLLVRTKFDRTPSAPNLLTRSPAQIFVSAFTGIGLEELKSVIADRLSDRAVSLAADTIALRPRHEAALRSALASLAEALNLVEPVRTHRSLPHPELIASAMRVALDDLAALAGDITPDDVLGRVFATFCVGK